MKGIKQTKIARSLLSKGGANAPLFKSFFEATFEGEMADYLQDYIKDEPNCKNAEERRQ